MGLVWIGAIMLAASFGALFFVMALDIGLRGALIVAACSIAGTLWLGAAIVCIALGVERLVTG